jgi:hypothetical protein
MAVVNVAGKLILTQQAPDGDAKSGASLQDKTAWADGKGEVALIVFNFAQGSFLPYPSAKRLDFLTHS